MFRSLIVLFLVCGSAVCSEPTALRNDALALESLINAKYAYLDRLPNGRFELTEKLRAEAQAIDTARELVRYAEARFPSSRTITPSPARR